MQSGMSMGIRILAATLSAPLALAALAATPAHAAASLVVPKATVDAGKIQLGSVFEHEFVFKNDGDEPVSITQVRPSCGCAVSDYPAVIEPGTDGLVKLRIDTKNLRSGKQSKTATVVTTAPNSERVVLQVNLDLYTPLEFLPKALVYLRTSAGVPREETVLARPHSPAMSITGASSDNEHIEVTLEPATALGSAASRQSDVASVLLPRAGDAWIKIALKSTAPPGILRAEVRVQTTDPDYTEGVIKVNAVVGERRDETAM
ncbi:MAG: DUF1573 domain-containing protein [Acidobacteriota bacterium]|nr:MAG: DUF1573 domain-containing protein [Acidobacteriota bacterium]